MTTPHTRYEIRFARTDAEREAACRLRHLVFFGEPGLDQDRFDADSAHLLICDSQSQEVVGTYRMRSSAFTQDFYSETEFFLSSLKAQLAGSSLLEVGRASVHPEHRNGAVIHLLWKGIMEYARTTQARYLFGCSSAPVQNPDTITAALEEFRARGVLNSDYGIFPYHSYREIQTDALTSEVPMLLQMYLKMGAQILGDPAYDAEFQCIDFFTLLDLNVMPRAFKRRYGAPELASAVS